MAKLDQLNTHQGSFKGTDGKSHLITNEESDHDKQLLGLEAWLKSTMSNPFQPAATVYS